MEGDTKFKTISL